jgi:flavin-dependent dehydrogenase
MKSDNIIIVGGGSAGWMTAATLIKFFPNKKITVIESSNYKTVGVGESTLGFINGWMSLLEIKDEDFLPYTEGTYKLSIRFEDFHKKGSGAFHYPFGFPLEQGLESGMNDWYFKKILEKNTPISNYTDFLFPGMALVNNNTIGENINRELGNFNLADNSAYHFDATKFGLWLKDKLCIPRGVNHILDDINSVEKNEDGIISLNNKYKADLFIDCTGFKSLLLGENLKEPFNSYTDLLPNNSAWATRIPYVNKEKELVSYTNCKAVENGWIWNIPSWNRIGTGYVYSDKYIDDVNALNQFKKHLSINTDNLEFNKIKMRVGLHERLFVKNVVAIGLSAGFIEPLESNGLFTVHEFLIQLVRTLKRDNITQLDRDIYNCKCTKMFKMFAEFVALHWYMSERDDTEYWRDLNKKSIIDKVFGNFDIHRIINSRDSFNYLNFTGLHCIATGMNRFPADEVSLITGNYMKEDITTWLNDRYRKSIMNRDKMVLEWDKVAKTKTKLIDYLQEIHNKK